jgi:molecular chaperone HtpG
VGSSTGSTVLSVRSAYLLGREAKGDLNMQAGQEEAVQTVRVTANIDRLLRILSENVNSDPYSAVREYVSNAHDATTGRVNPLIRVWTDANTIRVQDNGCGMSRDVIVNAFTRIAGHHENVPGAGVGRFGLGVLSAFMIADRLVVETRSADETHGWRLDWSKGKEIFSLECIDRRDAGTEAILHLSPRFTELAAEPELRQYLAKTFGLFGAPVLMGRPGAITNPSCAWLERQRELAATELLGSGDGFELIQQYCRIDLAAAYVAHLPEGFRIFLGIPSTEHAPLDRHKVAFFSRGVWVFSDAPRFFPENLAFVVALVDHPAFALQIDRQGFALDRVFEEVRNGMESHILAFMELLAATRSAIADAVMTTHRTMLLAHSHRSKRLRDLLRDHYKFQTNLGAKSWREVSGFAGPNGAATGSRLLYVLSDDNYQTYAVDVITAKGLQVVLAEGTERLLLEDIAAEEGIRIADAKSLMDGTDVAVVPDAFKVLAALLAAPLRRRGIPSVSFFQLAGQGGAPAMFRIVRGVRDSWFGKAQNGVAPRLAVRVESIMINVMHPLIEKLAGASGKLDARMLQRAADILYCVAALNSPFDEAKAEVSELIATLLVDALEAGFNRPGVGAAASGSKCFVALPYSGEFERVWQAIKEVFGRQPYGWAVVRADQDVRESTVLGGVVEHIASSRRFVADISGRNVNVMLELGIMLRQDPNNVLILTDDETFPQLPADLRGHTCLVYPRNLRERQADLASWLAEHAKRHPEFAAMRGNAAVSEAR